MWSIWTATFRVIGLASLRYRVSRARRRTQFNSPKSICLGEAWPKGVGKMQRELPGRHHDHVVAEIEACGAGMPGEPKVGGVDDAALRLEPDRLKRIVARGACLHFDEGD